MAPDQQAGTVPWVDISREPRWEGLGDRAHAHHSPPADLGFLSIAGMLLEGQGVALHEGRDGGTRVQNTRLWDAPVVSLRGLLGKPFQDAGKIPFTHFTVWTWESPYLYISSKHIHYFHKNTISEWLLSAPEYLNQEERRSCWGFLSSILTWNSRPCFGGFAHCCIVAIGLITVRVTKICVLRLPNWHGKNV